MIEVSDKVTGALIDSAILPTTDVDLRGRKSRNQLYPLTFSVLIEMNIVAFFERDMTYFAYTCLKTRRAFGVIMIQVLITSKKSFCHSKITWHQRL